ncbi:MAG: H(+)-transporting ATPase [Ruminococcus sp.]|nr:H(+)-transporting ATPase [Ruminococcus sp.]
MSGLDGIINIIDSQGRQNENNIIRTAQEKALEIESDGDKKAESAYNEYMKKSLIQAETDFRNSCNSVDSGNRRKILEYKVRTIEKVTENIITRLEKLSDSEYFDTILRLFRNRLHDGAGEMYFNKKDLSRLPADFNSKIAEISGDTVKISETPADIENGFILKYGLITENCTFRAILEAEKDRVRDILAEKLFGR